MAAPTKFEGWVASNKEGVNGGMKWTEFEPKRWEETDVDIAVSHCGICGSDIHTLESGWGKTDYPCVVGHEVIGKAVRVGSKVKNIKVGDRVGVGAQSDACFNRYPDRPCPECKSGNVQHCRVHSVNTYDSNHLNGDKAYGGYAKTVRVPHGAVFSIPDGIPDEHAAPMLCAGLTTWTPLRRYGAGPGKKVGIIGIGGLGHFGILWAKALGADSVVAISRSRSKEADARQLGADELIATSEDGWLEKNKNSFDIILCTASSKDMPLTDYIKLLRYQGTFVILGAPDKGELPAISAFTFIETAPNVTGSKIGSPKDAAEMLQFAAEKGVKPMVEVRPMKEANQAVKDFVAGKPRYRYVLKL